MVEIVLVYPPVSESIWGSLEKAGSILPPLGICSLAGSLRKQGISVKIIDSLALKLNIKETFDLIEKYSPKYVGITATSQVIKDAGRLAKYIKTQSKNIKIIIGGPHISALPKETLEIFPEFDIGVIGEGEISLIEIIQNNNLKDVEGLVIRENTEIKLTKPRMFIKNLDSLPFPAWDLLPNINKTYRPAITNYKKLPTTSLVTSRGCFGQCTFCSQGVFGRVCRFFSAEYLIKMIEYLKERYGIKDICFYDDNFLLNKRRVFEICRLMKQKKLNLVWSCDSRVDLVDAEILKVMKEAGCWEISYGFESGSQKILDNLKKNISIEQSKKAIKLTKEAGISVRGFFMIGCPGETEKTLKETYKFIKNNNIDEIFLSYFTLIPGSEVYKKSAIIDPHMFTPTYIPKGLKKEKLEEYYRKIYKSFYFNPKRIITYSKKLKDFKKLKDGFLAFLKMIKK